MHEDELRAVSQGTQERSVMNVTREARAVSLAMARTYPPGRSSLRQYYWSLAQGLRLLEREENDPIDCDAFTCYQCLDFDPDLQARFKEAWAREIGMAAGLITSLSTDLKNALEKGA